MVFTIGFGLDQDDLSLITKECLASFVRKHIPEVFSKKTDSNILDILKDYETYTSENRGPFACVAEILTEATGIRFEYTIDESSEFVFYPAMLSWNVNSAEKNLTADRLQKILDPFLAELGIPACRLRDIDITI